MHGYAKTAQTMRIFLLPSAAKYSKLAKTHSPPHNGQPSREVVYRHPSSERCPLMPRGGCRVGGEVSHVGQGSIQTPEGGRVCV